MRTLSLGDSSKFRSSIRMLLWTRDFVGNRSSWRGEQKRRPPVMMRTRDTLSKTQKRMAWEGSEAKRNAGKCVWRSRTWVRSYLDQGAANRRVETPFNVTGNPVFRLNTITELTLLFFSPFLSLSLSLKLVISIIILDSETLNILQKNIRYVFDLKTMIHVSTDARNHYFNFCCFPFHLVCLLEQFSALHEFHKYKRPPCCNSCNNYKTIFL